MARLGVFDRETQLGLFDDTFSPGAAFDPDLLGDLGQDAAQPVQASPAPTYGKGERVHRRGSAFFARTEAPDSGPWSPRHLPPLFSISPLAKRLLQTAALTTLFVRNFVEIPPPPPVKAPPPSVFCQAVARAAMR